MWYSLLVSEKPRGVIEQLLPNAGVDELRDFVQRYAASDAAFSVKLSQWLMSKYARHANDAATYVVQVEQLFCLTEEKYHGYNRSRYYDDIGLDWDAIDTGMEKLVHTLSEKLAAGVHAVVVPPVLRFYQLLGEHEEDFMSEDEGDISAAREACEDLLTQWVQHPAVPQEEKKALYPRLHGICHSKNMKIFDILTASFFADYLVHMQSPEEALERLNREAAMGHQSADMVHKHVALLRQSGREREAQDIIRTHLCFQSVLDAELERLYSQGEDDAALNLIDLAKMQGKADSFMEERRIRFLQRVGDTPALINLYRALLTARWNTFHYYYKLKELVPQKEWPAQYELIKNQSDDEDFLIRLYAAEKDYPALFQAIMDEGYNIQQLVKSHLPNMPVEYHEPLLQRAIYDLASEASRAGNRKEYTQIASRIRELAKLPGARVLTEALVARLRSDYRKRPAFIEELNKLP